MVIVDIILYLIIYSFLGWCCESLYCSVLNSQWINRGFLNGPFCPVYGFGAIITLFFLQLIPNNFLSVFIGGIIITSSLEYFTSWIMEKLFHARWWDYSEHKFNINGRVCLLNSTLFGLLCLFLYFQLHPLIKNIVEFFNLDFKYGFLFAFLLYFIADFTITIKSVLNINIKIKTLSQIKSEFFSKYPQFKEKFESFDLSEIEEYFRGLNIKEELIEKFKQYDVKFFERRIIKAFPQMSSKSYPESFEKLKQNLRKFKHK